MVKKKWIFISVLIIFLAIAGFVFVKMNYFSGEAGLATNIILIKLNMETGGEATDNIRITNTEMIQRDFSVYFNKLDNLASIDEKTFSLGPGESKEIKVFFKDNIREVGVYTGQLIIETFDAVKKIPIILTVEGSNPPFAIIQSTIPKYENVYPNGKLGVEIKVFDLDYVSLPNVHVKYSIKNFNNEIIWSDEEDLTLGESMNKIINLPNVPLGDYVFITTIDYAETQSVSSYLFNVVKKDKLAYESSNFFIVIILIFVVGSLALLFYFIKRSDDLLIKLQKQQNNELQNNINLLNSCRAKVRTFRNKKKIREWKLARKKIIKGIRHKHKIQRIQLQNLKKHGKKNEVSRKLNSWKKHGFKMVEAEKEMKKVSGSNINKQLSDFKKQGYRIGFLK